MDLSMLSYEWPPSWLLSLGVLCLGDPLPLTVWEALSLNFFITLPQLLNFSLLGPGPTAQTLGMQFLATSFCVIDQ